MSIARRLSLLNEISIIFNALVRTGRDYGASINEMIRLLGFKNESLGRLRVYQLLAALERILKPIGLRIVYIPIRRKYVIKSYKADYRSIPIPPGALATLFAVAKAYLERGSKITIDELSEIRNVSINTIKRDLKILESFGLIKSDGNYVKLTDKALVLLDIVIE